MECTAYCQFPAYLRGRFCEHVRNVPGDKDMGEEGVRGSPDLVRGVKQGSEEGSEHGAADALRKRQQLPFDIILVNTTIQASAAV